MPAGLNAAFVASLPDAGPVVMLNLMRFRKAAADGSGSGWDAGICSRWLSAIAAW